MKQRTVVALAGLVSLLVMVAWFEAFYRPETSHISALRAKQQVAAAALLTERVEYAHLVNNERELPAERAALAKLEQMVPDNPDLDSVVTLLFGAATQAGVQLNSISSPPPSGFGAGPAAAASTAAVGPGQLQMTIEVTGTEARVERLYKILDSEPRLFVIDNCSFGLPADTQSAGASQPATMNVRTFFASTNPDSAAS